MKRIDSTRALLCSLVVIAAAALPSPARAQVQSQLIVSGLNKPLAFVQNPSDPTMQVVVQQDGHIRTVKDGNLLSDDFLDLSDQTQAAGELGLLGFAFAPDYGVSGRCFAFFIDHGGNSVVSRFVRSGGDPMRAEPGSRVDLIWPDGNPYIYQPSPNHKGGNLVFGPDGYLYVGLGDGGPSNDPDNRAQDPASLLGKIIRIDVSVSDDDPEGYDVPASNPFVGMDGVLPEIWSLGLRNPWRWSFDDPAHGGTGAMLIGDVGQDDWEELDYQAPANGGMNYGWRLREGAHNFLPDTPVAIGSVADPIYEYSHALTGYSITGGYVYRGRTLGPDFNGRYVFADFVEGRVYSTRVHEDGFGGAWTTDLQDHTNQLGSGARGIASFGVDADGEIYLVSYSTGRIYRLVPGVLQDGPTNVQVAFDGPGGVVTEPVAISGWAVDLGAATTSGIDEVHLWAVPADGSPAIFLGAQASSLDRPDIAAAYGARFRPSGFSFPVSSLASGTYTLLAYAHSGLTHNFERVAITSITVTVPSGQPRMNIDTPAPNSTFDGTFILAGWALDAAATVDAGVAGIQVWAERAGEAPRFVGQAPVGIPRADVAAAFGSQFLNSGWGIVVGDLPPGAWTLHVYQVSKATGTIVLEQSVPVFLNDGLFLQIDFPATGTTVSGPSLIVGWALDRAALHNPGVAAIHIWAVPSTGAPAIFLGGAQLGDARPDVGAAFGPQFANAGYDLTYSLAPGDYDIVVYAFRASSGSFDLARVVHVTVTGG